MATALSTGNSASHFTKNGRSQCIVPVASATGRIAPFRSYKQQRRSIRPLRVQAIGFDFGDREPAVEGTWHPEERIAKPRAKVSTFTTLASSLLVFQHVFKGAVGEAFLGIVTASNKYQAANKDIIAAYGKFYNLLLTAGYDNWQTYVLDQILLGRDNSFARAVAQGNLEPDAPILKAVAYDLDVLQELSLSLAQLAEYVSDVAPTAGPYWTEAASSVSVKQQRKQLGTGITAGSGSQIALNLSDSVKYIQRPPTELELKDWQAAISGKEAWSEAVPLLRQYYHLHGFGITSRNSTLRWSKGALEEGVAGDNTAKMLSLHESQYQALAANTQRHIEGRPARHVVVCGPPGSGKSFLLWHGTQMAGCAKGLRVVEVTAAELPNILDIARGCARYPRVRFVLVADNVDFPLRPSLAADISSALSGGTGPSGWPSNTLLYVGATSSSTVSYSDPSLSRFGLVLPMGGMDEPAFEGCVGELREHRGQRPLGQEQLQEAKEWAKQLGVYSVQTAAQFCRLADDE